MFVENDGPHRSMPRSKQNCAKKLGDVSAPIPARSPASSLAVGVFGLSVKHLIADDQAPGGPEGASVPLHTGALSPPQTRTHWMYLPSPRGLGTAAGSVAGHLSDMCDAMFRDWNVLGPGRRCGNETESSRERAAVAGATRRDRCAQRARGKTKTERRSIGRPNSQKTAAMQDEI